EEMAGIWEPRAGILHAERCLAAHLSTATRLGANLRYEEPVVRWQPAGTGVRVVTTKAEYSAAHLVLCARSWMRNLTSESQLPLTVERQVLFWFNPKSSPALFYPEQCPIHLWQFDGQRFFYGFPDTGDGIKVACHHDGEFTAPELVCRDVA